MADTNRTFDGKGGLPGERERGPVPWDVMRCRQRGGYDGGDGNGETEGGNNISVEEETVVRTPKVM